MTKKLGILIRVAALLLVIFLPVSHVTGDALDSRRFWPELMTQLAAKHRIDSGQLRVSANALRKDAAARAVETLLDDAKKVRATLDGHVDTSQLDAAITGLGELVDSRGTAWQLRKALYDLDIQSLIDSGKARLAAWKAEQQRIAERARLAHAASTVRRVRSGPYVEHVAGAGGQSLVNACAGSVIWEPGTGYPNLIVEHWGCGGAAFPKNSGARVTLSGAMSGRYVVLGLVATLDASTSTLADIPRGYDLLYQTCWGGNHHATKLWALRRTG